MITGKSCSQAQLPHLKNLSLIRASQQKPVLIARNLGVVQHHRQMNYGMNNIGQLRITIYTINSWSRD